MKYRFIGDIHGDFHAYIKLLDGCENSVQVGDFGIGFGIPNPVDMYDVTKHGFIRGNHDNPSACKNEPNYIEDGTIENGIMFVGGAASIDRAYRTEGLNWWADEELSYEDLYTMHDIYDVSKPRVMITHDCPEYISNELCIKTGLTKYNETSRTRTAFESMHKSDHQLDIWIFGHWHEPFDEVINGTRFICLDINQYIDLDIGD